MDTNNNTSVGGFEEKYASFEAEFNSRKERSEQFYKTANKVAKATAYIVGALGLGAFIWGGSSFCNSYSAGTGAYSKVTGVALALLFAALTTPMCYLVVGVVCVALSAAIGYGLAKLTARVIAHLKDIDYFSPKMSDRDFCMQNKKLTVQREGLEKLFYEKYGVKEGVVVKQVQDFIKQKVEPLNAHLADDKEFSKIVNKLNKLSERSDAAFYDTLKSFSNQELHENFGSYDQTTHSARVQFEEAQRQLDSLLVKKMEAIRTFQSS